MADEKKKKKNQVVREYLYANQKDGKVVVPIKEVASDLNCSVSLIRLIAKDMQLSFPRRAYNKKEGNINMIRAFYEEDPDITYEEIGKRMGLSRQRICAIVRKNGLVKKTPKLRKKTREEIYEAIRAIPCSEKQVSVYIQNCGICYKEFVKFKKMFADDPDLIKFLRYFKEKNPTKIDLIRDCLINTDLNETDIAEKFNVKQQYVSRVNRRYGCREKYKRYKRSPEPEIEEDKEL